MAVHTSAQGVTTQVDPCVPIDLVQFQRLLALELGADIEQAGDGSSAATVTLSCVEAGVELRLEDSVTRKSMTRTIDFARVESPSRSRLMALTVAEFVVASWLELRLQPSPAIEPAGRPPPPVIQRSASRVIERRIVRRTVTSTQLSAAFESMSFLGEFQLIPCGALRVVQQLAPSLALGASVQVGRFDVGGLLGPRERVTVHVTSASLLASLLYVARLSDFELTAGAGVRVGLFLLDGSTPRESAFEPQAAYVPWGGPVAQLGATYLATSRLRIGLSLEAGYLRHVRISARGLGIVAELKNGWIGASLGLGWSF